MNLGDLKDSLLNMGKEKGKEAADNYMDEHEGDGGLLGKGIGLGRGMLDNVLEGNPPEDQGVDASLSAEPVHESEGNDQPDLASDDRAVDDKRDDGSNTDENDDQAGPGSH